MRRCGQSGILAGNTEKKNARQFQVGANPRFERWNLRDLSGDVLREYTATGYNWTIEKDYIYRDGMLLAAETPEGERHFHLDHLGTPRLITDGAGNQVAYHVYYPFGEEATDPFQDQMRMKFTGHERDLGNPGGTGDDMDYMHHRFYSPLTCRFSMFDPSSKSVSLTHPQARNKYAYVLGKPLAYIDPFGELWFEINGKWTFLEALEDTGYIEETVVNDDGTTTTVRTAGLESLVTFDGSKISLYQAEGSILTVAARAGRLDKEGRTQPQLQDKKDIEPIPEGEWAFDPGDIQTIGIIDEILGRFGRGRWLGGSISWGKQRVWLYPAVGTDTKGHSGFTIHGGSYPGSRGCIDLWKNAPDFFNAVDRTIEEIPVFVNYPDPQ